MLLVDVSTFLPIASGIKPDTTSRNGTVVSSTKRLPVPSRGSTKKRKPKKQSQKKKSKKGNKYGFDVDPTYPESLKDEYIAYMVSLSASVASH